MSCLYKNYKTVQKKGKNIPRIKTFFKSKLKYDTDIRTIWQGISNSYS